MNPQAPVTRLMGGIASPGLVVVFLQPVGDNWEYLATGIFTHYKIQVSILRSATGLAREDMKPLFSGTDLSKGEMNIRVSCQSIHRTGTDEEWSLYFFQIVPVAEYAV